MAIHTFVGHFEQHRVLDVKSCCEVFPIAPLGLCIFPHPKQIKRKRNAPSVSSADGGKRTDKKREKAGCELHVGHASRNVGIPTLVAVFQMSLVAERHGVHAVVLIEPGHHAAATVAQSTSPPASALQYNALPTYLSGKSPKLKFTPNGLPSPPKPPNCANTRGDQPTDTSICTTPPPPRQRSHGPLRVRATAAHAPLSSTELALLSSVWPLSFSDCVGSLSWLRVMVWQLAHAHWLILPHNSFVVRLLVHFLQATATWLRLRSSPSGAWPQVRTLPVALLSGPTGWH